MPPPGMYPPPMFYPPPPAQGRGFSKAILVTLATSIFGWVIATLGVAALGLVFAKLGELKPSAGGGGKGMRVVADAAFGRYARAATDFAGVEQVLGIEAGLDCLGEVDLHPGPRAARAQASVPLVDGHVEAPGAGHRGQRLHQRRPAHGDEMVGVRWWANTPERSETPSAPKTSRKTMLPMICAQPPWRNMEERSVRACSGDGSATSAAGVNAWRWMKSASCPC